MTIWVVRAGRHGEREKPALKDERVFIGWSQLGDLSNVNTREEIRQRLMEIAPDMKPNVIAIYTGQIFSFVKEIQVGDICAMPLKSRPAIAFGKVCGNYEYIADNPEDFRHSRKVEWIREPIPRGRFDQDNLVPFGSSLTVFGIREIRESRIKGIIEGKQEQKTYATTISDDVEVDEQLNPDLLQLAQDGISDFIGRKFKGHRMEDLVAEVLEAQGFEVRRNTSKGRDGGVDILAGKGPMGLDEPLLAVQVKSGDSPIDSNDYSRLKGVLPDFGATHGLFVSWGGFNNAVEKDAKKDFFKIRLWNAEDLVREIQDVYPNLPKTIQAELPMKQIWVLIDEVDEG